MKGSEKDIKITNKTIIARKKKESKLIYFKKEIEYYLEIGVNIKGTWRIINAKLPSYSKITYQAFYNYVKKSGLL